MTHEEQSAVGIAPSTYRLPASTRLGRVRLQIGDLDRSLEFYTTVLGLQVLAREERRAVLGADGRPLVELVERKGAAPVPRHGRLGLYHFAILLPGRRDLGRFLRHVADVGVRVGMSDHLVSEAIYLSDPDGLGIEVYADRPRDSWQSRNREIAMTTEPLNVEDLVRASGSEPWTEMPAGTVIGHVHLHVGDLKQATAFYHEGVGFDKVVWSYPGALFLSAGGYHHHLGTNIWARGADPAGEDDARLLEWSIILPDRQSVDAIAEHLESVGYHPDRGSGELTVADPWGTVVRISTLD